VFEQRGISTRIKRMSAFSWVGVVLAECQLGGRFHKSGGYDA
jgi:hypothetical protein